MVRADFSAVRGLLFFEKRENLTFFAANWQRNFAPRKGQPKIGLSEKADLLSFGPIYTPPGCSKSYWTKMSKTSKRWGSGENLAFSQF